MNEKGRQTKLLAAIAVIAMVVCALAVAMPSTDATSSDTQTGTSIASVAVGDKTTYYDSYSGMVSDVNGQTGTDDVTITILKDFDVTLNTSTATNAALWFTYTGGTITINGGENIVGVTDTTYQKDKNILGFGNGVSAVVSNLTLDGEGASHHGINIYGADVILNDVKSENNIAAGVTVNGGGAKNSSEVTTSNIATSSNGWGGINVDNNGGSASLAVNGTPSIRDTPQIWSEANDGITFAQGLNFVESTASDGKLWYTQQIVVTGDLTAEDIEAALDETPVVQLPADVTVDTELIPDVGEGQTIVIPADAEIVDNSQFRIAEGGSIVFAGAENATFTITGGNAGSTSIATFSGVTGNFTVTGGSVHVTGTLESGTISGNDQPQIDFTDAVIAGDVTIEGNGTVEFMGDNGLTVNAGASLTLGSGITYTAISNVTVNGALNVNGALSTTGSAVIIVGTGEGAVLSVGSSGTVSGDVTATVANLDAVSNKSFWTNDNSARAQTDVTLVGSLANEDFELVANGTSYDVYVYKQDVSDDYTFTETNGITSYAIRVGTNGSYSGTVTMVDDYDNLVAQATVSFTGAADINNYVQFQKSGENWNVNVTGGILDSYQVTIGTGASASSAIIVREYSAVITGLNVGEIENSTITVALNSVSFGTMSLEDAVTANGVSVPAGEELSFEGSGSIDLNGNNMYILGSLRTTLTTTNLINGTSSANVYTMNLSETRSFVETGNDAPTIVDISGGRITIDLDASGMTDAVAQALLDSAEPGMTVFITNQGTKDTLVISSTLDLNGVTIEIDKTKDITIQIGTDSSSRATVTFEGVTVDSNSTDSSIVVMSGSSLDITDSLLFIVVDARDGSTVNVDNEDVVYENTSSNVSVGYGTTLTLTGNVTSVVDVYGTLVIESTATVPERTVMTVYQSGSVVVDGTLTILGEAEFMPGSTAEINGTVTVGQYSTGGAVLDVDGDFTISESGTVTITGVADNNRNKNILQAPESGYVLNTETTDVADDWYYQYRFDVYGTLAMNGTMSGYIHNLGTVTFDGIATTYGTPAVDATVVLYDGVTMTVGSIDGILRVTDQGVLDENLRTGQLVSDGNVVSLSNVRNVIASVASERFDYTDDGENYRNYRTIMSISGEATTGTGMNGRISILSDGVSPVSSSANTTASAYVLVEEGAELNFGNNVYFVVNHFLVVDGGIEFFKAQNATPVDNKTFTGTGPITVNGTIATSENAMSVSNINAVKYVIKTTGANATTTDYYTSFTAAVSAAPDADQDRITVMGEVNVPENVTIPAGVAIQIQNGGSLVIGSGAEVILSDGATMTGGSTTNITVEGTFTAQDYDEDLNVTNVIADVMSTSGASRTWTSLSNAIGSGMTDITLNRPIVIDEDLTIPEGVTVTTNIAPATSGGYSIYVDGAELTIDGTLAMLETSNGAIGMSADVDSEITVNGVYYARIMANSEPSAMNNVDGAHFAIGSGASTYYYVSNVEFAAQTTSDNDNLDSHIVIKGIVAAGDVTFTAADSMRMYIDVVPLTVNPDTTSAENMTILSAGTVSLVGDVTFTTSANTRTTAVITAPCGDGTTNASVQLTNVQNTVTLATSSSETATATEYTLSISSTNYDGTIGITAGTVTIDGLTVSDGSFLAVASGAILEIPAGETLTVSDNSEDDVPVIVDGTIILENADGINGDGLVEIPGTMEVTDGMNLDTNTIRISGTLQIAEGEILTISGTGKIFVGDKPASLGETVSGTVNGIIRMSPSGTGYILAYEGADMSGAQIDINAATGESDAAAIQYYINGTAYATIYAYSGTTLSVNTVYNADGTIELRGYDEVDAWYANENDAATSQNGITTNPLRNYEAAYAVFAISDVAGTISVGNGLTMYIDGLTIDNYLYSVPAVGGGYSYEYRIPVGSHSVSIAANSGYNADSATITFNGQTVANGGSITIEADATGFILAASGAVAQNPSITVDGGNGGSDMGLTDYLLIVLVILIVIMAIIVALRLMRS